VTARFDHPGVGISPAGFLPVDVFPTAQPLVFLIDDDEDGEADSLVAEPYGTFTTLPPAVVDRPNAGASECTVFGMAGAIVTVGGCDAAGNFSGEALGAGHDGPPQQAGGRQVRCEVPIVIDNELVGRMELDTSCRAEGGASEDERSRAEGILHLMADMIGRLWDREKQLRARVEELGTLYRLGAEFTGRRDLQGVLDLVAKTVVDVLKAKACSIRLLNEDRTELLIAIISTI